MNKLLSRSDTEIDVSIIIVNWNTVEFTLNCLASITVNPPKSTYEIWVVDNASTDESVLCIHQQYPEVNIIENQENIGFGAANNQAIKKSRGRYVHLVNSDVVIQNGAIQAMVDFMDGHLQAGACGSYYLNPDGSLQTSCYPFPTLEREFWRLFHLDHFKTFGIYRMNEWDTTVPRQVEVLQGASLLLRREALSQVGLFDPDFFMYTEEVDLCYRMQQAGWKLFWLPSSRIIHFGGQSTRQAAQAMFLQLYRSKHLFFLKQYGSSSARWYTVILTASAKIRLLAKPFLRLLPEPGRTAKFQILQNYQELLRILPTFNR